MQSEDSLKYDLQLIKLAHDVSSPGNTGDTRVDTHNINIYPTNIGRGKQKFLYFFSGNVDIVFISVQFKTS